ncbi:hypothetical protein M8J76_002188 [Diaphorina citri]|nr:hypothetical protein M8J76_002188 [Diaphorina citri]
MTTRTRKLAALGKDLKIDLEFIDSFDSSVEDVSVQLYCDIRDFLVTTSANLTSELNVSLVRVLNALNESVILQKEHLDKLNSVKTLLQKAREENQRIKEELNSEREMLLKANEELLHIREVLKSEREKEEIEEMNILNQIRPDVRQETQQQQEQTSESQLQDQQPSPLDQQPPPLDEQSPLLGQQPPPSSQQSPSGQQLVLDAPNLSKKQRKRRNQANRQRQQQGNQQQNQQRQQQGNQQQNRQQQQQGNQQQNQQRQQQGNQQQNRQRQQRGNQRQQQGNQQQRQGNQQQRQGNQQQQASSTSERTNVGIVTILGDSQARNLDQILREKIATHSDNVNIAIGCTFWSGKTIVEIANLVNPDLIPVGSHVVLFGGTNDVFRTPRENIKLAYDTIHNKLPNHQVTVILVPPRTNQKRFNYHIKKLNCLIKYHISQFNNFNFIDTFKFLKQDHFAKDGLHLDRKGKSVLCDKILYKLFGIQLIEIGKQGAPKSKVQLRTNSKPMGNNNRPRPVRLSGLGAPSTNRYQVPPSPMVYMQYPSDMYLPPTCFPPSSHVCCPPTYRDMLMGNVQHTNCNPMQMYPAYNGFLNVPPGFTDHSMVHTNSHVHPHHTNNRTNTNFVRPSMSNSHNRGMLNTGHVGRTYTNNISNVNRFH